MNFERIYESKDLKDLSRATLLRKRNELAKKTPSDWDAIDVYDAEIIKRDKQKKKSHKAFIDSFESGEFNGEKFKQLMNESVLSDNASFYGLISEELHNKDGVNITSDEPLGSNVSCFSYSDEDQDDDSKEDTEGNLHRWNKCHINMDDDGLYWESESGHKGCLLLYSIVKSELNPKHIKLWIAPIDGSDEMGVVEFRV
jgi:hypothetical protein